MSRTKKQSHSLRKRRRRTTTTKRRKIWAGAQAAADRRWRDVPIQFKRKGEISIEKKWANVPQIPVYKKWEDVPMGQICNYMAHGQMPYYYIRPKRKQSKKKSASPGNYIWV